MTTMSQTNGKVAFKLKELRDAVRDMDEGREKSIIMTKIDEIRHWHNDVVQKDVAASETYGISGQ